MTTIETIQTIQNRDQSSLINRISQSLATKLLLGVILIMVPPLILVNLLTNIITSNELRAQVGQTVEDTAVQTANQLHQTMAGQVKLAETAAKVKSLREQVIAANATYFGTEQETNAQLKTLDDAWQIAADNDALIVNVMSNNETINVAAHQLRELQTTFPAQTDIIVTDRYGGLVAATERVANFYHADRRWWQTAWNNGQGAIYVSELETNPETGLRGITIAIPVRQENEVVGILRTTIQAQALLDILAQNAFAQNGQGRLVVFDRAGKLILDPFLPTELMGSQLPADLQAGGVLVNQEAGWLQTSGLSISRGEALHGYAKASLPTGYTAVDTLNWTTISILPATVALAPVNTATRWQIVLFAFAFAIAASLLLVIIRRLTRQAGLISSLFKQLTARNYDARVEVISQDELGQVATNLNGLLDNTIALVASQEERDQIQLSIQKLLAEVSDVAEGDLTVEAEVTSELTGAIADSFNYMISQLRQIISNVQETIIWVTASAREIQGATEKLAQGSEYQAKRINDASMDIQDMAASMRHVSENATQSVMVAQEAQTSAQLGTTAVHDTMKGMRRIQEQVEETAKRITRLGESSHEIGEIVQVINDIADRTSILALNASIQAAAAGESGRGFAVVAAEVEELAAQAARATQQITGLIKTVQTEIGETITAMEESSREVEAGAKLSDQAGQTLTEIDRVSNTLTELIQAISRSAEHQAQATEGVATSVSEIATVTQQTATDTRQTAQSIDNLTQLTDGLRKSVSAFKLPNAHRNGYALHD